MYKITDIIPFMRAGWVAMDEDGEWHWWQNKPEQRFKEHLFSYWWELDGYMVCLSTVFDLAPADDWTKSLIRIDNDKREKLKEEFNNNIQKVLSND